MFISDQWGVKISVCFSCEYRWSRFFVSMVPAWYKHCMKNVTTQYKKSSGREKGYTKDISLCRRWAGTLSSMATRGLSVCLSCPGETMWVDMFVCMFCSRSISFRLKTHSERSNICAAVLATSLSFCKGWGLYTRCRCINIWYIHIQAPPKSALWMRWWDWNIQRNNLQFQFLSRTFMCTYKYTLWYSISVYWVVQLTLVSVSCKHISTFLRRLLMYALL